MHSRPATLPGWLLAELDPIVELATVLAGSTPGAADLVAESLARDPSWAAADSGYRYHAALRADDLTPRLRTGVIRTFLGSSLGRSTPPPEAVGLDVLTGPARAVVALRDGEHLTVGEIAAITDRPVGRVAGDLAATAPGSHDAEIAELVRCAPQPEVVAAAFLTTARQLRRSRRRRSGLLAVIAAVVVAAVAVPAVVLPRLPVDVRERGVWRYSHEVVLGPDWVLLARAIAPSQEMTAVRVPWVGDDPAECTVTVRVAGSGPDRADGDIEPTRVRTRRAELVTRPGNALSLNWEYSPGAWATVACDNRAAVSAAVLHDIAAAVRFRDVRQRLPFTLTGLPEGYRISTVGETFAPMDDVVWGPTVLLEPPEGSYRAALIVGPDLAAVGDAQWWSEQAARCLDPAGTVCVTAFQTDDQVPPNVGMLRQSLTTAIGHIRLAPDPTDHSTWLDAITLPAG